MLVGEYASLNASHEKSLNQLLYLRDHGVSTLHVMWWPSNLDKGFNQAQESALLEMISKHDSPRKGLAGGISEIRPWRGQTKSFDIASLGTGPSHTGLLKSLNKDGTFEGTVYAVPFHAHVNIEVLNEQKKTNLNPRPKELATILHTRPGSVIEVSFKVKGKTDNLLIDFAHRGIKLSDKSIRLDQIEAGQQFRLVYKIPLLMEEIKLLASSDKYITIEDLLVVHHQDQVINLAKKIMTGKRHQGGVTFACLPQ
jgi:hypothetical protein